MAGNDIEGIRRLQERINSALLETPEDRRQSDFSDYRPDHSPALVQSLMSAAAAGGSDGIEAALDEFDRLATSEDRVRMQHALMIFLTEHPATAQLGLRVPSLEERSYWKVLPSKPAT